MKKAMVFFITIFFLLTIYSVNIKADNKDFFNLSFEAEPILTDTNKVHIKTTWQTSEEILFLKVICELPNGNKEYPYETGRDNIGYFVQQKTEIDSYWNNELSHDINFWQIGTLKVIMEYSFISKDPLQDEMQQNTYYFVTGKWQVTEDSKDTKIFKSVVFGLVITISAMIATYIIIGNTRKNQNILGEEDIDE